MGEWYLPFLSFSGREAFILKWKKNQIKSQVDGGVMRYGKRLCLVGKIGKQRVCTIETGAHLVSA